VPGSSAIRQLIRPAGLAGLVLAMAALTACTSGTSTASGTPAAARPAAVVSPSGAVSSSAEVSPSPSPSVAAASPTPKGGGRYGYGGGDTPSPTPTPAPMGKTLTVKSASTGVGKVLVGPNGLTLYTLTADGANASTCTGTCANDWPPLTVKSGTKVVGGTGVKGAFATFTRPDGTRQVSYRGRPLYYFAGDQSAGDTGGQGIGGVWFVARP
jgi:predicted lipoprotein with Yx(FWY)xxD motif